MVEAKLKKTDIRKINKKLLESLQNYKDIVKYMGADLPVGCLCLPQKYEKKLLENGILRVYDLFNRDLTKIKGIGKVGIGYLTASLQQFIPMG